MNIVNDVNTVNIGNIVLRKIRKGRGCDLENVGFYYDVHDIHGIHDIHVSLIPTLTNFGSRMRTTSCGSIPTRYPRLPPLT